MTSYTSQQDEEHQIAPDFPNPILGFPHPAEAQEHHAVAPSTDVPTSSHGKNPARPPKEPPAGSARKRKAPDAPKRFKSSYILFFMAKQAEIKAELGTSSNVSAVSRRCAELWRNLSTTDRAYWDSLADKDKARYNIEKSQYTGPWQVPWRRRKKDSAAPKKPMSAFLIFSQYKRAEVKASHPDLKNTEVSRLLGEMWRGMSAEERSPHVEREKIDRAAYKVTIQEWRKEQAAKEEAQRKAQAKHTAEIQARILSDPHLAGQKNPAVLSSFLMMQQEPPVYLPTTGHPVVLGPNGLPVYQYGAFYQQPPPAAMMAVAAAAPTAPATKPPAAPEPNATAFDDTHFDFATGDDVDDILSRG